MKRIRFYEWLAGKLIGRSARLRARRAGPNDAHELRHLWAAINAGNSDGCDGGLACHLDRLTLPNYPSVWTEVAADAWDEPTITSGGG